MKTILYLRTDIIDYELTAGGSVTHTLGVIKAFAHRGYRIICASSCMITLLSGNTHVAAFLTLSNPRILKFLRWKINSLLSTLFFTIQIIHFVKKQKMDYLYQRYSILNSTGVLLKYILKKPLILEYNGSERWVTQHWSPKRVIDLLWLIEKIELLNLRHADYITVVSQVLYQELQARGIAHKKIIINPNGVDTSTFDPQTLQPDRISVRKKLNINDRFVFGFIGTFGQWHGIHILEHMMQRVIAQRSCAYFILIGDGVLCPALKKVIHNQQLDDHVLFTGMLSMSDAIKYLAACDAFLAPNQPNKDYTRFFGSPTKLFEYMSLAKPVIASDLEQLATVIKPAIRLKNNKTLDLNVVKHASGFLVPPHDSASFVDAAIYVIDAEKETVQKIGKNARNKVIHEYSWTEHVQRIIRYIEKN